MLKEKRIDLNDEDILDDNDIVLFKTIKTMKKMI